jgi:purine-binding chemotaxis protein CheW
VALILKGFLSGYDTKCRAGSKDYCGVEQALPDARVSRVHAGRGRIWHRDPEGPGTARLRNAGVIKGVVNLRGIIVPIIDMRIKFNLGTPNYDQFTVVIILNIGGRVMGMVVDSVSDVITLTDDQIRPAPDMGRERDVAYITGMGVLDERMLILTDIDKLMSATEIGLIDRLEA